MKAIVCYYSWHGHTAEAGKAIAEAIHGQAVEIMEVKQRRGLFGWLAAGRGAMSGKCTPIQPLAVDWSAYDTVFIGSPVWASAPATPVNSLIRQANLTSKRVYVFGTSGGPGNQPMLDKLASLVAAKGGQVAGSFCAPVKDVKPGEIATLARNWAASLGV
jgi:flavodoxin